MKNAHAPKRSGFPAPLPECAPRLLLISGAPASGKTVLAAQLRVRYAAVACSKDELKEILFDQLGSGDAAWSRRLSDASFALLFALAARLQARAADAHRHVGHRDAGQVVETVPAGFLELPGPRLRFDSEAPQAAELAQLCAALDRWAGCEPCTLGAQRA